MSGCQVMGDGFDDAGLEAESRLDQVLAIARRTAASYVQDGAACPALLFQFLQALFHRSDGIAVVVGVVRVEDA